MGVLHNRHLRHQSSSSSSFSSSPSSRNFICTFAITLFLLFAASTSAISTSQILGRETGGAGTTTTRRQHKEIIEGRESNARSDSVEARSEGMAISERRRLVGPGSSPPTCRSKCGKCTPCRPVHVPIHPGVSVPLEYYPEAWRCKCGNKLFMP